MKKSVYSKVLAFLFVASFVLPLSVSFQSCGKPKYNRSRNGGSKVNSSGKVGYKKSKNRHVWGK